VSLLLLHLLHVMRAGAFGRLLGAFDEHDQSSGMAFAIEGRRRVACFNVSGDIKFTRGLAAKDAVSGRNVKRSHGQQRADVAMVRDKVVGGVEPTQRGGA